MAQINQPDFKKIFESAPGLYLILLPDLTIVAVSNSYASATMTKREEILGKGLFEVFPDNPDDVGATGVSNLRASLNIVKNEKKAHTMAIQKYDIRRPDGTFEERHWSPLNTPVLDENNEVIYIIHRVEDVTEMVKMKELEKQQKQKIKESTELIEQMRQLSEHLQNIREEERANIAREIHDELGQQMTAMKMDISWLLKKMKGIDDTVQRRMGDLTSIVDETIKSIRRIAAELRPGILDDLGLIAAIEWQLKEFEKRSGIHTKINSSQDEPNISEHVKTGLFRIFQESLTNVARHAKAKHVNVSFLEEEDYLILTIADDGVGFEAKKVMANKTFGLLGMKERSTMMGGSYEIFSTPKKGTVVSVTVPLQFV